MQFWFIIILIILNSLEIQLITLRNLIQNVILLIFNNLLCTSLLILMLMIIIIKPIYQNYHQNKVND